MLKAGSRHLRPRRAGKLLEDSYDARCEADYGIEVSEPCAASEKNLHWSEQVAELISKR